MRHQDGHHPSRASSPWRTILCSTASMSTTAASSSPRIPQAQPSYPGVGRLYHTEAKAGARLRLRLINPSSFLSYWFSIDNHTLTVVELDGVEVEPLRGERVLYLNTGQRVSVVVALDQVPGHYHTRATVPQTASCPTCHTRAPGSQASGTPPAASCRMRGLPPPPRLLAPRAARPTRTASGTTAPAVTSERAATTSPSPCPG